MNEASCKMAIHQSGCVSSERRASRKCNKTISRDEPRVREALDLLHVCDIWLFHWSNLSWFHYRFSSEYILKGDTLEL